MADEEKQESVVDTVAAAVAEQKEKAQVEPGPKIGMPEPKEEPVADEREGDAKGEPQAKAEPKEDEGASEDKPEEPKEAPHPDKPDISRPPRRLPVRTKGVWQTLAPELREDIWAREQEFDKAFKRYDGLTQYAIQAERIGTTLPQVMQDYRGMETALRQDPIQGAITVWQRLGYDASLIIGEILRRAGGDQSIKNPPMPPSPPGMTQQEAAALFEQQFEQRAIQEKARAFEEDPRYHFLEPAIPGAGESEQGPIRQGMMALLRQGLAKDYPTAYAMSCRANGVDPGIASPNGSGANSGQAKKAAAVNQSRAAAKATVGAPSPSAGTKAPDGGDQSVLDTVRAAFTKQRG